MPGSEGGNGCDRRGHVIDRCRLASDVLDPSEAVLCLGPLGRAALVGLTAESMSVHPYSELINKEAEIIGVSDHLAAELPALIEFARSGKLRFPPETLRVVDLDAAQINAALDALQESIDHVRTVIKVASKV